jgi:predicted nucleic acid-binding protein
MGPTDKGPPLVVCDAGPLIHLDELEALDLLSDFAEVLVPNAVWTEVERHRPGALSHPCLTLQRITPGMPVPPELDALARIFSLHAGEWEALRVVLEYAPGLLLTDDTVTDDTAARMAAGSLRIDTHGTFGILVRSIRGGQRTHAEVVAILQAIPSRSTLHLKRSLLDQVISEVQRSYGN